MSIDTFMRSLFFLCMLGLLGSALYAFGWRPMVRKGRISAELHTDLWRTYRESCRWVLRCRWALLFLTFGVAVGLIHRLLFFALGGVPWRSYLIPSGALIANWARVLTAHLSRWTTYVSDPMESLGRVINPLPVHGWLISVTGIVLLVGLWLFRTYTVGKSYPEQSQPGIRFFNTTLNWLTFLAGVVLANLLVYSMIRRDSELIWRPRAFGFAGNLAMFPFWAFAGAICAALFVSTLLGSLRTHLNGENPERLDVLAFRHYKPLFAFFFCLLLATDLLPLAPLLASRFLPMAGFWDRPLREISFLLSVLVRVSLFLVPAVVVADGETWLPAIRKNFRVWRSQPGPVLLAVVFFAAITFAVNMILLLIPSGWIVTAGIRQWVQLVFQTTILLGVYRFYLMVGTDAVTSRLSTREPSPQPA